MRLFRTHWWKPRQRVSWSGRAGPSRVGLGRFVTDIDCMFKKKHFMFYKSYRKKKSIDSWISRCLKVLYDYGNKLSTTGSLVINIISNYLYHKSILISFINLQTIFHLHIVVPKHVCITCNRMTFCLSQTNCFLLSWQNTTLSLRESWKVVVLSGQPTSQVFC